MFKNQIVMVAQRYKYTKNILNYVLKMSEFFST